MIHLAGLKPVCDIDSERRKNMKKAYEAPRADKMEFNYVDNVTASNQGWSLREYVHGYQGCRETATDNWFLNFVRESGCKQI